MPDLRPLPPLGVFPLPLFFSPSSSGFLDGELEDLLFDRCNELGVESDGFTKGGGAEFKLAISNSLSQSMEKYDNLIIMGQDIAEYGGVFKITDGFVAKFGKDRIRNTPICESVIVSLALG